MAADTATLSGAETVLLQEAHVVTDEMIDAALNARVPGGAEVWWWLPTVDGRQPHETARVVIRSALTAALQRRATLPTVPADLLALREALEPFAAVVKMAGPGRRGVVCGFNDTVVTWEHFHALRAVFDSLPSSDVGAVPDDA